jgi:hypothetical protein
VKPLPTTMKGHTHTMAKMKTIEMILMENHPDGNFNEQDLWEAIAEADGHQREYYADGDLTEWL